MSLRRPVPRLLVAVAASLLLVASAVAIVRVRDRAPSGSAAAAPSDSPSPSAPEPTSPAPEPSPQDGSPSVAAGAAVPVSPERAEAVGGEALLDAGIATASGPWADLGSPEWEVTERPVYVADVRLVDRTRVEADVVIGFRADRPTDELVLRLLPASRALTGRGADLSVAVRRDGRPAPHEIDHDGARLLVSLDPTLQAGEATTVRVLLAYDLVDRRDITDDGGPAGFGLLAWNADATLLGHWLPLLTFPSDDGPMIAWGDVGAFPAAVWSVVVHTDAALVTGGSESDCPAEVGAPDACVWARGVALRDVSAVAYDQVAVLDDRVDGIEVRSLTPPTVGVGRTAAHELAVGSVRSFRERFGPLAWNQLDVAAAPLSQGAAGMEFPGIVVIDTDVYGSMVGGFGAFVVAHEVAHQWFHALVGNGSLSAPVVDESLAQYLSYLFWADAFGEGAADAFAADAFADRYRRGRAAGVEDEPPGQPLDAFEGGEAYGPLVYARATLAWLAAEDAAGRDAVVAFLAEVVDRWGLAFVDDEELVAFAEERAPEIGAALRRYWLEPGPVEIPGS